MPPTRLPGGQLLSVTSSTDLQSWGVASALPTKPRGTSTTTSLMVPDCWTIFPTFLRTLKPQVE